MLLKSWLFLSKEVKSQKEHSFNFEFLLLNFAFLLRIEPKRRFIVSIAVIINGKLLTCCNGAHAFYQDRIIGKVHEVFAVAFVAVVVNRNMPECHAALVFIWPPLKNVVVQ